MSKIRKAYLHLYETLSLEGQCLWHRYAENSLCRLINHESTQLHRLCVTKTYQIFCLCQDSLLLILFSSFTVVLYLWSLILFIVCCNICWVQVLSHLCFLDVGIIFLNTIFIALNQDSNMTLMGQGAFAFVGCSLHKNI